MHEFDNSHYRELVKIASNLNTDTIGDEITRAVAIRSIIIDPSIKDKSDQMLKKIRDFSRGADIGWKVFENQSAPNLVLTEMQTWQLLGISSTLLELNYCFERVEEASLFTFANAAPVRFYVNAIFHYLTALFLLDAKRNKKGNLPHGGTVIKVLHPIGLSELLDPIHQVFNRPFGENLDYGATILEERNGQFVHGSFSPENINSLVKDSNIFDERQKLLFMQNHFDIYDRLIIFRLQIISILTLSNINLDDFSPSKLYHL